MSHGSAALFLGRKSVTHMSAYVVRGLFCRPMVLRTSHMTALRKRKSFCTTIIEQICSKHPRVPKPASSTQLHSSTPLRECGYAHSIPIPNTTIDIFRHPESVKSSLTRANSHAQPRPDAMCEHKEAFSFQHFEWLFNKVRIFCSAVRAYSAKHPTPEAAAASSSSSSNEVTKGKFN